MFDPAVEPILMSKINDINECELDIWDCFDVEDNVDKYWSWSNLTGKNREARNALYQIVYESSLFGCKMLTQIKSQQ